VPVARVVGVAAGTDEADVYPTFNLCV